MTTIPTFIPSFKQYRTRKAIKNAQKKLRQKIELINEQLLDLERQNALLSDKKQRYKEEIEEHGKGKNKKTYLVGRVYWVETFKDQDTGTLFPMTRSQVVKQDGEWI